MDRANCTRSRCAFGARSVIATYVLLALPLLDSCSRPASPQEQPKASKAAGPAVQSALSQPTTQAQTPAAVPFAVLALAPGRLQFLRTRTGLTTCFNPDIPRPFQHWHLAETENGLPPAGSTDQSFSGTRPPASKRGNGRARVLM